MELRQLRYFVALAEHLHFGRAAAAVCISQPALSQQIQKLEQDLGTKLFFRNVGHIELTRTGYALLPRARETLRHCALCYAAVAPQPDAAGRRIRLSYPGSASNIIARMALAEFADGIPASLELTEGSSVEALAHLAGGDADIAITWLPLRPNAGHTESLTFFSIDLMVVVSAKHRLAQRDSVAWDDLAGETQVLFERALNPAFYDHVRTPFKGMDVGTHHIGRGVRGSENFFASIGMGFSLSAPELDATLVDNPTVKLLPLRDSPLCIELAAHHGCNRVDPAVRKFIHFLASRQSRAGRGHCGRDQPAAAQGRAAGLAAA